MPDYFLVPLDDIQNLNTDNVKKKRLSYRSFMPYMCDDYFFDYSGTEHQNTYKGKHYYEWYMVRTNCDTSYGVMKLSGYEEIDFKDITFSDGIKNAKGDSVRMVSAIADKIIKDLPVDDITIMEYCNKNLIRMVLMFSALKSKDILTMGLNYEKIPKHEKLKVRQFFIKNQSFYDTIYDICVNDPIIKNHIPDGSYFSN